MLYLYYHCDEYKSEESMILIGVFEESTLRNIVAEDLKDTDIIAEPDSELEIDEIYDMDIREFNDVFQYCYIKPIKINERISNNMFC